MQGKRRIASAEWQCGRQQEIVGTDPQRTAQWGPGNGVPIISCMRRREVRSRPEHMLAEPVNEKQNRLAVKRENREWLKHKRSSTTGEFQGLLLLLAL